MVYTLEVRPDVLTAVRSQRISRHAVPAKGDALRYQMGDQLLLVGAKRCNNGMGSKQTGCWIMVRIDAVAPITTDSGAKLMLAMERIIGFTPEEGVIEWRSNCWK